VEPVRSFHSLEDTVTASSLHTNNHQLNFDEAVRRLAFWSLQPISAHQQAAVRMLIDALRRNRTNLYFEVQ
jgi:hypothetical protein